MEYFLAIPDQEAALKAIRRVLKEGNDNTFANGSWRFDISDYLASQGFGVSLQDVFALPSEVINPGHDKDVSFKKWANKEDIKAMFAGKSTSTELYQSMHSTVWDFDNLWTMLAKNPLSAVNGASEADAARARQALEAFITKDGSSLGKPLMLSTVSILCVTKGFAAATK